MPLREYTCKLDGFKAEGTIGIPEEFWKHMEQSHAVDVMVAGRELARKWIAKNVEEKQAWASG